MLKCWSHNVEVQSWSHMFFEMTDVCVCVRGVCVCVCGWVGAGVWGVCVCVRGVWVRVVRVCVRSVCACVSV
jgi:hypothetical protein